jgi:hypothetical protein
MRKVWIAVVATAAVFALVATALANNTYKVHKAGTTAKGKGSLKNPIPTGIIIGFQVGESDSSKRATVLETYAIGAEGILANGKGAPKCDFNDLNDPGPVPTKCNKARVGGGIARNMAGPSTDTSKEHSLPCNLDVDLYNIGTGMAIHLDSHSKPAPGGAGDFSSRKIGCPLPIDGRYTIKGKFVKTKIGGVTATDFRFTVPENLRHPAPGVDNSIFESVTDILKRTKNGKGFYNKVGCKGKTRTTRATFTSERTATQAPVKSTATKTTKC